jgi:uncharacterized phage protein (TIGR02220 family)
MATEEKKALEDFLSTVEIITDDLKEGFLAGFNYKKKENDKIPYQEIIAAANEILKRNFKVTATYKAHISARWREGFRVDDFIAVCKIKAAQWKDDPAMTIYLRPETLWGTKMSSYCNEPMPKAKKMIANHLGVMVEVDED